MNWCRLPPQSPEDCRFRGPLQDDSPEKTALCGLVRTALPQADDLCCRVPRSTCLVCCQAAPATPSAWNPVVGSLVYRAAASLLVDPHLSSEEIARAKAAQTRALVCLETVGGKQQLQQPVAHFDYLREVLPPPTRRSPERIRKWAVGVTTSPRARSTLDACLEHLTRAGWESPHLFMDSAVRVSGQFRHLSGTLRSPAIGAWPNHYLALFELTMRHPDADAFLIMQDDALIYDGENVREYLEEALWPGRQLPIVSLFCPEPYTADCYGWHRYRKPWVWGAQAFIFPREVLQRYLRDRDVCQHRWRSARAGLKQIDVLLGCWARWRRVPFWVPTPSLVQHIGETSTLWVDGQVSGPRAARLFVGNKTSETPSGDSASTPE